jgi:hypothetical protein
MQQTWKVVNKGRVIEEHPTAVQAHRAMLVLAAHDLRNGRVSHASVTPQDYPLPAWKELDMPPWAEEVLLGEELPEGPMPEAKRSQAAVDTILAIREVSKTLGEERTQALIQSREWKLPAP